MGKGRGRGKAKKPAGLLQQLHDRAANDKLKEPLVNEFASAQGDYEINLRFVVNRGGTPIARWKRANLLSETQEAAILHCIRLWELTDTSARLVANLDRTVFGTPGDGNMAEIQARKDLARIEGGFPPVYWNVFHNVCRFDEPAGVAGSKLMGNADTAAERARVIVAMVADMIYFRERLSY